MSDFCFDSDSLRESVKCRMDEKRYAHALGVECAAVALGEIYLPDKIPELRCAALLHDITKNETIEKQLQYIEEFGIMVGDFDKESPALLHAKTAAAIIPREFPEYAAEEIVNAVRWHTTGREDMSLFEAIIYLADLIEDGREYDELICLREEMWSASPRNMPEEERLLHLYNVIVHSLDNTIGHLADKGAYIDEDTLRCRNYFISMIRKCRP